MQKFPARKLHGGPSHSIAGLQPWNLGAANDRPQSGLMLANLITLAHFSVSAVMNFWHSAGVIGMGMMPRSANRALSLGSARTALTSLLSIAVISAGVPFGAPSPCQVRASNPGTYSPTVGKSGSASARDAIVTASGRSIPLLIYPSVDWIGSNTTWTWPAIRSVNSGAEP